MICVWHRDVNDLWCLELLPARRPASAQQEEPFNVDIFKARQARACAVIHATPTPENKSGKSLHDLVRIAACGEEANEPHEQANLMLSQLVV